MAYINTQYVGYSSPVISYEQAQEEDSEALKHMYRVWAMKTMKFSVIRIRILEIVTLDKSQGSSKVKKRLLLQPLFHVMIGVYEISGNVFVRLK